jgi:hypothetical protein
LYFLYLQSFEFCCLFVCLALQSGPIELSELGVSGAGLLAAEVGPRLMRRTGSVGVAWKAVQPFFIVDFFGEVLQFGLPFCGLL